MLQQAKRRQKRFRDLFESSLGKEVMRDLFKICRVNHTDVTNNSRKDAYNQGRRSIYLNIINILGQDLDKIIVDYTKDEINE